VCYAGDGPGYEGKGRLSNKRTGWGLGLMFRRGKLTSSVKLENTRRIKKREVGGKYTYREHSSNKGLNSVPFPQRSWEGGGKRPV